MTIGSKPKVAILQHRLLHYRVEFFSLLKEWADQNGIDLHLVHGQAAASEKARKDEGYLPWADAVHNTYFSIGGRDLLWQPLPASLQDAHLFVIMQENRIFSNYPYLFGMRARKSKLAYWGHGANFQSRAPDGIREVWKRRLMTRVDWWFAYTAMTVRLIEDAGFPAHRITCLNNAVDTRAFAAAVAATTESRKAEIRRELRISATAPVAIFCGSLYPDKRLQLLEQSARLVKRRLPEFHVVVIGDGPSAHSLEKATRDLPWFHMVGVKRGQDKADFYSLATVMLNPGLLGLHILDSFAIGLPLLSTVDAPHSPEVAYLENGINGELVNNDPVAYANSIIRICSDKVYWENLSIKALEASSKYTLEAMVRAFAGGIQACLKAPASRFP